MSGSSRGHVVTPSIVVNLNSNISQIAEMSSNDIRQLIKAIQERDDRSELLNNIVQGIGSENQPGTYGDLEGTHGEELAIRQHQLDIMQQQIADQNANDIIGVGVSQAQARTIALYKYIADAKENPSFNNLSVLRDALILAYNLPKALEILNKISPTPSNSVFYAPPGDPASRGLGSPDPNYGRLTEPTRGYTPGEPVAPSKPILQNNNSSTIYTPPEFSQPGSGYTPGEPISPSIPGPSAYGYGISGAPPSTTLVGDPDVKTPLNGADPLSPKEAIDKCARDDAPPSQADPNQFHSPQTYTNGYGGHYTTQAEADHAQDQQQDREDHDDSRNNRDNPVILDLTGNGVKITQKMSGQSSTVMPGLDPPIREGNLGQGAGGGEQHQSYSRCNHAKAARWLQHRRANHLHQNRWQHRHSGGGELCL